MVDPCWDIQLVAKKYKQWFIQRRKNLIQRETHRQMTSNKRNENQTETQGIEFNLQVNQF